MQAAASKQGHAAVSVWQASCSSGSKSELQPPAAELPAVTCWRAHLAVVELHGVPGGSAVLDNAMDRALHVGCGGSSTAAHTVQKGGVFKRRCPACISSVGVHFIVSSSSRNLGGDVMSAHHGSYYRQTRAARTRRPDVQLTNGSWDAEHRTDRTAACRIINHHVFNSGPSQHLLTIREVIGLDDEAAAEESSRRSRRAWRRRNYVGGSGNHSPNSLRLSQITLLQYLQAPAGRSAGGMRRGIRAGG
jgi:hypothetical protein